MEFNKVNTLIYETLENIATIETSRVSMFDVADRYRNVPFCRFKFKHKKKEDEIYKKIQSAIGSFEGNLKWKLVTKADSENFLIIPVFSQQNKMPWNDKEYFISLYGVNNYRKKIDKCIDDIPKLALAISSVLK